MQQIFTKDFIFERIRDCGYPLWSLSLCQGFKNTANVMTYLGSDFEDDDTDETKVDKSIEALDNTLSTFPENSEFVIELKNSPSANGRGIVGPFTFINSDPSADDDGEPAEPTTPALGSVPPGYIPESALKGLQDSLQRDFQMQLDNYKAEAERQRKEDEYKRRLDALAEREKELKEQEKEYNSSVAKAADVLIAIGKRFGASFLMPSGTQPQAEVTELGSTSDPKAAAVDDFAAYLYQNFSAEDIVKLKQNIQNYGKSHMAQQSAADPTE